jgi:uncharacterized damage-inducible protein DinB
MASAQEIIEGIRANRQTFRDAIAASADRWENVAEGEEWSPRQVAEHAIGAERSFAGMMAAAVGQEAPAKVELSLAGAAEADTAMDASREACIACIEPVTDENLSAEAPMPDGAPFPKSVEGVLQLVDYHLQDHAGQISKS